MAFATAPGAGRGGGGFFSRARPAAGGIIVEFEELDYVLFAAIEWHLGEHLLVGIPPHSAGGVDDLCCSLGAVHFDRTADDLVHPLDTLANRRDKFGNK